MYELPIVLLDKDPEEVANKCLPGMLRKFPPNFAYNADITNS